MGRLQRGVDIPDLGSLAEMSTASSCRPLVVLQVPDALAQSFRLRFPAIFSHIASGRCVGGLVISDEAASAQQEQRWEINTPHGNFFLYRIKHCIASSIKARTPQIA